jgi:hypothetical protein
VDYFVFLDNVDRPISTDQVRSLFHATLLQVDDTEAEESGTEEGVFSKQLVDEKLKLGRYTIDPRFTDFKGNQGISNLQIVISMLLCSIDL